MNPTWWPPPYFHYGYSPYPYPYPHYSYPHPYYNPHPSPAHPASPMAPDLPPPIKTVPRTNVDLDLPDKVRVWVLRNIPYRPLTTRTDQESYVQNPDAFATCVNVYVPLSSQATAQHQQETFDRVLTFVDQQRQSATKALGMHTVPSPRPPPFESAGSQNVDTESKPFILYVHGGAWRSGHRAGRNVHDMLSILCRKTRCICVSIGYRLCQSMSRTFDFVIGGMVLLSLACFYLTPKEQWLQRIIWMMLAVFLLVVLCIMQYLHSLPAHQHPTAVSDIAAAVQWVTDHGSIFGGDVQRLTLMGHSAGAHLVLCLYANPTYWSWTQTVRHHVVAIVAISGVYSSRYMQDDILFRAMGRLVFGTDEEAWNNYFPSELADRYRNELRWPAVLLLSAEFDYGLRYHAREFYEALSHSQCAKLDWLTVRDVNHFSICHFWEWQHHKIAQYIVDFLHSPNCSGT